MLTSVFKDSLTLPFSTIIIKTDWTVAETESQKASPHFKLRQHDTEQVLFYGYVFLNIAWNVYCIILTMKDMLLCLQRRIYRIKVTSMSIISLLFAT